MALRRWWRTARPHIDIGDPVARRRRRAQQCLLGVVLVAGSLVRIAALLPPGYALDEEITSFAVDGIRQHGLPLLPSGALEERGLPYSYAAWSAGSLFGYSLTSYRTASLGFGIATLIIVHAAARLITGEIMALSACVLLALWPIHIEASGWARFYSLGAAAYLSAVVLFLKEFEGHHTPARAGFLVLFTISLLAQELAVTLMALPILAAVLDPRRRATHVLTLIGCGGLFAVAAIAVGGLHFLAPNQELNPWLRPATTGGDPTFVLPSIEPLLLAGPMVWLGLSGAAVFLYAILLRYTTMPPIIGGLCLIGGLSFQLGLLALAVSCASILRPRRWRSYLLYGGIFGLGGAIFWSVHTSIAAHAVLSVRLMRTLSAPGLRYSWETVIYLVQSLPLSALTVGTVTLTVLRSSSAPSLQDRRVRLLLTLTILNLVLLSVLNLPLRSRYLLLFWPVMLVLVARGLQVIAGPIPVSARDGWSTVRRAAAAILMIGLAVEHYRYGLENPNVPGRPSRGVIAVPRIDSTRWSPILAAVPPDALVLSNDELASIYHLGRVDYWLVTDRFDINQYAIPAAGDRRGRYGNSRVITSAALLLEAAQQRHRRPFAVVLFDTGRFEFGQHRQLALDLFQDTPGSLIREAPGLVVVVLS